MKKHLRSWEQRFSWVTRSIGLMAVLLLLSIGVFAQEFAISGKVTDQSGEGLSVPTVPVMYQADVFSPNVL